MTAVMTKPKPHSQATGGRTFRAESARFPLEPLAERMGIVLLVDGEEGGQQPGRQSESMALIAARLGVSMRTVRYWAASKPPARRWSSESHPPGLSARQADRYAVMAGFMPWQVWPDWWDDAPGEEDLFDRGCRCRSGDRRPVGRECDRCGGRLPSSRRAA